MSRNSNSGNSRVNSLAVVEEEEWGASRGEITVVEATVDEGEEVLVEEGEEVEADFQLAGHVTQKARMVSCIRDLNFIVPL